MKPRLKLHSTGRVTVLVQGHLGWTERQARAAICAHYGNLRTFSERLGISYAAAAKATTPWSNNTHRAGQIAFARTVLGLPSQPTAAALSAQLANARRQSKTEPDWVFGVEVQP